MNNVRQLPNREQIKDEAATWVVKMHGLTYKTNSELPKHFVQDLKAWMDTSPEHRDYFLKMLGGWEAMSMLEELADILPLSDLQQPKQSFSRVVRGWTRKTRLGLTQHKLVLSTLSLVAVIAFTGWIYLFGESTLYETPVGQRQDVQLTDGSTITLNTNTRLRVDFSRDKRVVKLEHGEANFEVAKDTERPFVVYAGDGMVWAVGTAFNVNYVDNSVNVIVSKGTVKVFSGVTLRNEEPLLIIDDQKSSVPSEQSQEAAANPIRQPDYFREVVLDAGEAAQYSQHRVSKEDIREQELEKNLAWKDGVLIFQGETLEEALLEISRYTDRQLVIVDPIIGETSVGGRFKTDDIDALIDSLALGLEINTEYKGGSILFSAQ